MIYQLGLQHILWNMHIYFNNFLPLFLSIWCFSSNSTYFTFKQSFLILCHLLILLFATILLLHFIHKWKKKFFYLEQFYWNYVYINFIKTKKKIFLACIRNISNIEVFFFFAIFKMFYVFLQIVKYGIDRKFKYK